MRSLMLAFRILEHTADVGFEAFGASREEVFENAARALVSLEIDLESVSAREEASIEVTGSDLPNLLVNWLSEILYLHDAEQWVFGDFEIKTLDDRTLQAIARGEKANPARHVAKLRVKAVTYHQLSIKETLHGWSAQVYVDI